MDGFAWRFLSKIGVTGDWISRVRVKSESPQSGQRSALSECWCFKYQIIVYKVKENCPHKKNNFGHSKLPPKCVTMYLFLNLEVMVKKDTHVVGYISVFFFFYKDFNGFLISTKWFKFPKPGQTLIITTPWWQNCSRGHDSLFHYFSLSDLLSRLFYLSVKALPIQKEDAVALLYPVHLWQ